MKEDIEDQQPDEEETVELVVDGTLDLHTFAPQDIKYLIPDYLDACVERGISYVRIIHGKGKGVLRRITHAALDGHPAVIAYGLENELGGSWGVTEVRLKVYRRA